MMSQKTKKQIGQMQTPGAENAMLKNRVAGCTDDKRSVAGKCHFFRISLRVCDDEDAARASDTCVCASGGIRKTAPSY
jgi:hypothetical protein